MPADTTHPLAEQFQPSDLDVQVWRYMSLPKLLSLLQTSTLYLARVDTLDDPYEGTLPLGNIIFQKRLVEEYARADNLTPVQAAELNASFGATLRSTFYINCWHGGRAESAAMWKQYGSSDGAVAVQSTYRRLVRAIADTAYMDEVQVGPVYACEVQYVDYSDSDTLVNLGGNAMGPYVYKREELAHEREIRLFGFTFEGWHWKREGTGRYMPLGITVEVDLDELIEEIVVRPTARAWEVEVIRNAIGPYVAKDRVRMSRISAQPPSVVHYGEAAFGRASSRHLRLLDGQIDPAPLVCRECDAVPEVVGGEDGFRLRCDRCGKEEGQIPAISKAASQLVRYLGDSLHGGSRPHLSGEETTVGVGLEPDVDLPQFVLKAMPR